METISRYLKQVLYDVGELRGEMIRSPSSWTPAKIRTSPRWCPCFKVPCRRRVVPSCCAAGGELESWKDADGFLDVAWFLLLFIPLFVRLLAHHGAAKPKIPPGPIAVLLLRISLVDAEHLLRCLSIFVADRRCTRPVPASSRRVLFDKLWEPDLGADGGVMVMDAFRHAMFFLLALMCFGQKLAARLAHVRRAENECYK
ncbi:unnamed protein product [Triticum turgidum subsp. durum]|uniref:Uncharacterized protein n=1 Tax=Triticum turgidum subsp. durum TaxID=4567 RepID=A0A9R0WXB3_TRITD|nr:unnamed protein product [Triticum turgidum subsp. durum]